jgi:hypothetical protein
MQHDQPEPTEEEQELVPERQQEEEAMRGPGHEDPEPAREPRDEEIHDA